jgi:hypothetical protein
MAGPAWSTASGWEGLGGAMTGAPASVWMAPDQLEVLARGKDNDQLFEDAYH